MKLTTSRADRKKLKQKRALKTALETWYPRAEQLQLLDVPADKRDQLRARLAPILSNLRPVYRIMTGCGPARLAVTPGQCFSVGQSLVLSAQDPNVKYVEGAWFHLDDEAQKSRPDTYTGPHGWTTVDGYVVDLASEMYIRLHGPSVVEREPLHEFSCQELEELLLDANSPSWEPLTPIVHAMNNGISAEDAVALKYGPNGEKEEPDPDSFHEIAFKPAVEALAARLIREGKVKPPTVVPDGMDMTFYAPCEPNDGSPIYTLWSAFEDVGFCVNKCECCDEVGYVAHKRDKDGNCKGDATWLESIGMYRAVVTKIKNVPELREDYDALAKHIQTVLREKHLFRYDPKAFKFEIRFIPKETAAA